MYEEAGKNTYPSAVWRIDSGCSHVISHDWLRGICAVCTEIVADGHRGIDVISYYMALYAGRC